MSGVWKLAIKNFLAKNDEKELRVQLRKEWIDLYPEEKDQIYNFLFHARQHKLFIYLFAVDLQSQIVEIPWVQALSILTRNRISISEEFFKEFAYNFKKQKLIAYNPKTMTDMINDLKKKNQQAFMQKVRKMKQELIASARIAKSERLMDQYVAYMNELRQISPNEYKVSHIITDQEKQRAMRTISKLSRRREGTRSEAQRISSDEEQFVLEQISKQADELIKSKKVRPSDFAFLFRTLGDHKKAIDFVYQNTNEELKDWQLLDYLFNGKQYVSLLEHCQKLKKKYAQYPDALFSVSYAESVAYWELGEKDKALDLMGQIAAMRPDFKSASETLAQWKEESFE